MNAVNAVQIALLYLIIIISLPELSFSLDVTTDLGSTLDNVESIQDEIVDDTASVVKEGKVGDTVEEGADIIEETASTLEETAGAAIDTIPETTNTIQESAGVVEEEIVDPISNAIEEDADSSLEDSDEIVESTVDIIEEALTTVEETADVKVAKELDTSVATDIINGVVKEEIIGTAEEVVDVVEEQIADAATDTLGKDKISLSSAASSLEVIQLTGEGDDDLQIISNPKLTEREQQQIIEEALNVPELKKWSSEGGWNVVGMDFIGTVEPRPLWEEAIVYLHLPNNAGNPPIDCQQGWHAVIDISLVAGKVTDAGFPTLSSHECNSDIILQEPDKLANDSLSPSPIRPSFIIAETDDVISNDIHGTAAYLNTPSYNSSIFAHMDSYTAFMLNQKWSTSPTQHMTQIGWLMTSIEGCVDCGSQYIGRNSTALAFADSSVFGNLEAHKIPIPQWNNDEELFAGTWCNEDGNYTIWMQYAGKVFNHNTNISCENPDNDSKISNSIFFENWNTAGTSLWAAHILGHVEAHSAIVFRGAEYRSDEGADDDIRNWEKSTNEEQDCTGSRELTDAIEGNLTSGKSAKWIRLSDIPSAC